MKHRAQEECAAFVGRDWADAQHDVCLQAAGPERREFGSLEHRPEAIDGWGQTRRTRFNGQPIAVCLELKQGPRVAALRKDAFLGLFPGTPLTLAKYREAFTPSRAKDDPTNAALQVEFLRKHRDTLTPLTPHSPTMRALAPRVASRRRLVGATGRRTTRLPRALTNSFPQVLHWFDYNDTPLFCDFLSRWPTLNAAQRARRSTLEACFRAHPVRSTDLIATRLQAIKSATARTTEAGIVTPQALLGHARVAQLRGTLGVITDFDTAIARHAPGPPAFPLLDTLPGAGAVFAPRRLVAFGAHRARYTSADALQNYAGMAPVTKRRGKKAWGHWRLQCPTFLRHTFREWAAASIRHACWAQVYYQQQRDKGKAHQAAVRALACTWMRLLSRGWQERTPDDESVSLQALKRRSAPLLHNLAN
jgi:transposase/transposase IS116/IS110/IS902 family protein